MSKHYDKVFKVGDYSFRCKKLDIFEFNAFKTTFGLAINEGDEEKLAKSYKTLFSWLQYEVTPGNFVPAMDRGSGQFILPALEDLDYGDEVIQAMLEYVVKPLFQKSAD